MSGFAATGNDAGLEGPVPAFARKYNLSCNVCHTREPRLNPFGQRFQENGYQLPGTEDGGTSLKTLLGGPGPLDGATLDEVTNFLAARLRAEVQQSFVRQKTVSEDPDFRSFPNVVNVFFAGSATRNVSFYFETEFAPPAESEEAKVEFERVMLILTNLGRYQLANIRIGKIDPSAFFAFPTHRQQMNPIFPVAESEEFPPEIARIPVLPMAFAAKMFGLTRGSEHQGEEGFSILPFEPFFFNAPATTGAMLWGRPLGELFLYQIGVAQDETAEDEPGVRWDPYGLLRFDFLLGPYTALQLSGFYYYAKNAARPTLAPMGNVVFGEPVDWRRWGVGARLHYRFLDIYGTVIWDDIDDVVFPGPPLTLSEWDTQGLGVSLEADWVIHQNWFLGVRWDFMDPGGLVKLPPLLQGEDPEINQDASLLGGILKFYPVPNVGLYARSHFNLLGSVQFPAALGGDEHPARNPTVISALGVDMAF
ncbi:MAG: hypothetical protein GWN99_00695 [Gemmatimonadetes bacterium]|uniref:Uncharacterized protein n=1 Tax=Candidatus Kutchimonas denitrificans TaxID=3056748 RepID=A0AAE4Z7F1_9BACT|nr:hypothetical protein [Gemmatimonadota bacterium]NIR73626.1 hypothetical protein [Candidatus Kutchimonas denitrificans]NIR99585.1 hypothetical protein [Gemmatimonadota bacterium]NIT65205.1 hypothetical protein [Gemmatimonadota bacterium]NIV23738.1 hypothetical protein [Gemmatimonadota bacterium]